jgi:hypothetical protein
MKVRFAGSIRSVRAHFGEDGTITWTISSFAFKVVGGVVSSMRALRNVPPGEEKRLSDAKLPQTRHSCQFIVDTFICPLLVQLDWQLQGVLTENSVWAGLKWLRCQFICSNFCDTRLERALCSDEQKE